MNKIITFQDNNEQIVKTSNYGKKRIMIVDDEPDITLTFKMVLEDTGLYDVYTFNEPLKALANFKADLYDLVISDINMPRMNGYEFGQRVKEIDNDRKICFLTASEDYYYSNINRKQRRTEYFLRKPIETGEFINQMNSILQ